MSLKNRKVIVTGGPTREWLDPVRFISNPSTGKMGIAIADECNSRGIEVVFIHGPINSSLLSDKTYKMIAIESTSEMLDSVLNEIDHNTVTIMAAAPVDYTPEKRAAVKMKKGNTGLTLKLKRTPDILMNISMLRKSNPEKNLFVVGFAAETTNTEAYALEKLKSKNLDMICLNDVSAEGAGFGTDTNIVTIYRKDCSKLQLPVLSKKEVAVKILDQIDIELSSSAVD